jgi:hypothetical protein
MSSDRPYRRARPWEAAFVELDAGAAKQFDPTAVESALEREPGLRAIRDRFAPAAPGLEAIPPTADCIQSCSRRRHSVPRPVPASAFPHSGRSAAGYLRRCERGVLPTPR